MKDQIELAEKQIAGILADLEARTGALVDEVGVEDVEVTRIGDGQRQYQRRVVIAMARVPGRNWGQA